MPYGSPDNAGQRLLSLRDTVEKHFDGGTWTEFGLVMEASDIIDNHHRLLRSLSFGDPDYSGNVLQVLVSISKRDERNLEAMERYIRDRFGGGENVSSKPAPGRTIVFQPSVFTVPDASVDPRLISVMMPFELALRPVYQTIKDAATDCIFDCKRADDIWEHSTVIQDVFGLIFRSYIASSATSRAETRMCSTRPALLTHWAST